MNGQEALDVLEVGPRPDLIMLDMLMPVLDGWHLLERLKTTPYGVVPIVITTGTILSREWAAAYGCAGFLKKPIDAGELLAEVDRLIGRPEVGGGRSR